MKEDTAAAQIKELKRKLEETKLVNHQLLKDLAKIKYTNALIRKANNQLQAELESFRRKEENER